MHVYSRRLSPVSVGQIITVVGRSRPNTNRFDIELASDKNNNQFLPSCDVQLHLSCRFTGENAIVRNTWDTAKGWLEEDRSENLLPFNTLNPIKPGENFKVSIFVDEAAFFVSIDEKPFCTFPHRMPIDRIKHIILWQDVEENFQVNQMSGQPCTI